MSDCLHCEINEVLARYIEDAVKDGKTVNAVDVASMMSESIVDMILQQQEEQRDLLLAEAMRSLGHLYLEKSGALEGESTSRH
jgi:metal-sulfur cluster biosynthetic enzyme